MNNPRSAVLLARLSAVTLLVYVLVCVLATLNPAVPFAMFNRTEEYTPLSKITVGLLLFVHALSLPMLGLALYQLCAEKIQRTTAMMNAILYGVFFVLYLVGGLIGSYISTLTAAWDGAAAVVTVGSIRSFLGFFRPLADIAGVLLGCSVAITTYATAQLPHETNG